MITTVNINHRISVTPEFNNCRIDKFLAKQLTFLSRMKIQKKIKNGLVCVNNKINTIVSEKVFAGDICEIPLSIDNNQQSAAHLEAIDLNLDIVYEDEHLMVINKRAHMTVHPGAGISNYTLVSGLLFHCGKNIANLGTDRPGIVHRLDRDTTGLMLIAKSDNVHMILSSMIKERVIKREYLALCYRKMSESEGIIDLPIARNPVLRQKMQIHPDGKHAITYYKTIEYFPELDVSLLHCQLKTGRTHQIRVHLAHYDCPIIGDKIYSKKHLIKMHRQALHAFRLTFIHPITQENMMFTREMPSDMQMLLTNSGYNYQSTCSKINTKEIAENIKIKTQTLGLKKNESIFQKLNQKT